MFTLKLQRTASNDNPAERVTTSRKSLFVSNLGQADATLVSTYLPFPYTSCASLARFDWGDSAEQMQDQGCSLNLSLSLVAVTQDGLSFHYPAFPPHRVRQTGVYGNTAAESSPDLRFMNHWNMLQTLHPATPFPGSTLTFAHNSLLSSCKMQCYGLNRFSSWESSDWWENARKECHYRCATFTYINTSARILPHDLGARIQKERCLAVGFLLTHSI